MTASSAVTPAPTHSSLQGWDLRAQNRTCSITWAHCPWFTGATCYLKFCTTITRGTSLRTLRNHFCRGVWLFHTDFKLNQCFFKASYEQLIFDTPALQAGPRDDPVQRHLLGRAQSLTAGLRFKKVRDWPCDWQNHREVERGWKTRV